eukprot:scaffold22802_cov27-Attheya_sp.AAC.1
MAQFMHYYESHRDLNVNGFHTLLKPANVNSGLKEPPLTPPPLHQNASYYKAGLHSAHTAENSVETTNQQRKYNQPPLGFHSEIAVQSIGLVPAD